MKHTLGLTFLLLLLGLGRAAAADGPVIIDTLISDSIQDWFGDRIVPVGDQNGDGLDDFLVTANPFKLYLCLGGYLSPDSLRIKIDDSSSTISTSSLGFVNSDSLLDWSTLRKTSTGRWRLAVWYGGVPVPGQPDLLLGDDTLWPGNAAEPIFTPDIDNSGYPEFISGRLNSLGNPALIFFETGPQLDSTPDYQLWGPDRDLYPDMGWDVLSLDVNGDGQQDLLTNLDFYPIDSISGQVLIYWGGSLFDTIPDARITRRGSYDSYYQLWGSQLESIGDVNGDGWADFFVGYKASTGDTLRYIFYCGPDFDTVPDVTLVGNFQKARAVGDINHDGYDDLITGRSTEFSAVGYANIYLGGPDFDSIPDVVIDHSILTQGYYNYFAHEVAGIGDVTGDGIDDFAIGVSNGAAWDILIFAGWQGATDVPESSDRTLPTGFTLKQNFPNPFNPTTEIRFTLSRRDRVRLEVFDPTGRHVTTLVDRTLSAGEHTCTWDGTDHASGVYLYRLTVGDRSESKKMVLVK